MKKWIIGELLLLPLALFFVNYLLGVAYLAVLVITAKCNAKCGRFWLDVYKENCKIENKLFKNQDV